MIIWNKTLANVDDLQELAIAQFQTTSGEERLRYSLEFTGRAGREVAALTRTWRRPATLGGGHVKEEIRLDLSFAARVREEWPTSARTGGRAPQTLRSVLRFVAGPRAVMFVEVEARARRQRADVWRNAVGRAWPSGSPPGILGDLRSRLAGRMPMEVAAESTAGLMRVLTLIAPYLDAAEPWAPRVRDVVADHVDRFVASRTAAPLSRTIPDAAVTERVVELLTLQARPVVAEGLAQARSRASLEITGELGSTENLEEACWRLDERFRWPRPRRQHADSDLREIAGLVQRLRDVVAVEMLTETIGV